MKLESTLERQDPFTVVHNAIRAMLYDVGSSLQRVDFSTPASATVLDRLALVLDMLAEHAHHEDTLLFPEIGRFEAALIAALDSEHHALEEAINAMLKAIDELRATSDETARSLAARSLNRRFNQFTVQYLGHLNREEDEALPATWKHLTDDEIGAIRTQIQQSMAPERYAEWLRWIFSSQSMGELVTLFSGVKATVPKPILENMVRVARETLGQERWNGVAIGAGL